MATSLLVTAGILVGGYIIGKIAARVFSDCYDDNESRRSKRDRNTENGITSREVRNPPPPPSPFPTQTLPRQTSRQPPSPSPSPTQTLPRQTSRQPPSPSPTQTLPRQTTQTLPRQTTESSQPPSPSPTQTLPRQTTQSSQSPSPSPTQTLPRQTTSPSSTQTLPRQTTQTLPRQTTESSQPPSPSPTQTLPRQTTSPSQTQPLPSPFPTKTLPRQTTQTLPTPTTSPSPSQTLPRQTTQTLPRQTTESSQRSSSSKPAPSTEPYRPSVKPVLYHVTPSDYPTDSQAKTSYISFQDETLPIYEIPEDMNDLIKKGIVPGVLKRPLSLSTYADYFHALLYAEDHYIEQWDGFEMKYVTLKLHEAAIYKGKGKHKNRNILTDEKDDKVFIEFELDSIPEKRPFLLSRDFVRVRPSGKTTEPFQGIVYRVVKSNIVLVEFGEDFHSQHYSTSKYDVKFSFNRICLKRAHQAIAAALDPSFRDFLFPDSLPKNSLVAAQLQPHNPTLDKQQLSAVCQILSHQNPPPYLVEGPLSVSVAKQLSRTGLVVCEAVLQIYRKSPSCRILICAPLNSTCDVITRSLKKQIPESDMFRANAAFRELDGVPIDILPNCQYRRDCFSCPSLQELKKFKVVVSTFMSSFRLHNEGLMAGHFSHIFLVDASSATEPETMVALANLANKRTAVTITGALGNHSHWVRSDIARMNGLITSYFDRIRESKLYKGLDPKVITQL